jgi:hypothetical protein
MAKHRAVLGFALVLVSSAACGRKTTESLGTTDPGFDLQPSTSVEVYETGGLLGAISDWVVQKETGAFTYSFRHACTSAACPPALDSAKGVLSRAAADALFEAIARDTAGLHTADFGSSKSAADMINYVVRVRTNSDVVTDARGDDGTMPPQMHRIVEAVHAAISAARK